ncbi:MAG: tetratricopeptide repeat protein [Coriobacteriales bacterium]|nr:tetratricopeptide repeat protein [Coriobacteriales bacterium]
MILESIISGLTEVIIKEFIKLGINKEEKNNIETEIKKILINFQGKLNQIKDCENFASRLQENQCVEEFIENACIGTLPDAAVCKLLYNKNNYDDVLENRDVSAEQITKDLYIKIKNIVNQITSHPERPASVGQVHGEHTEQNEKIDEIDKNVKALNDNLIKIPNIQQAKIHIPAPLLPNKIFLGRDEELDNMKKLLDFSDSRTLVLNGMGGIGKTALAQKFAAKNYKNKAHWLNFEDSFRATLCTFINGYSIEGAPDNGTNDDYAYSRVLSILSDGLPEDALLIIDNVTNFDGWDVVKQSLKCSLLLTTRIKSDEVLDAFKFINIKELSENNCADIFFEYSDTSRNNENEEIVRNICKLANHHTLVVKLLAKTMKASKLSVDELLKKIQDNGAFNLPVNDEIKYEEKSRTFNAHIDAIFNIVDIQALVLEKLLKELAVLNITSISTKDLKNWLSLSNFNDLNRLSDYGWLEENKADDDISYYNMHDVIRDMLRRNLKPCYSDVDELCNNLQDEIKSLKDFSSDKDKVTLLLHQAISICHAVKDKTELETAYFAEIFGSIAAEVEQIEVALKLLNVVVLIKEKLLNPMSLDLANSYISVGILWSIKGKLDNALYFSERALGIYESEPNSHILILAKIYNNIGLIWNDYGKLDKAFSFYKKTLKIYETELDPMSSDLAGIYNNIGYYYYCKGTLGKAWEYYKKAINIREKVLNPLDPELAISYKNIGNVLCSQGNLNQGYDFYIKASTIEKAVLGPLSPSLATTYHNIGWVLFLDEKFNEALDYSNKALKIREEVLDPLSPDLAMTYDNIGNIWFKLEKLDEAYKYHTKALKIREEVLDPLSPELAISYNNVGADHMLNGNFDNALDYHTKALKIREEVLDSRSLDLAASYLNIGTIWNFKDYLDRALDHYNKALNIYKIVYGSMSPILGDLYNNIGLDLKKNGNPELAQEYFDKAQRIIEAN